MTIMYCSNDPDNDKYLYLPAGWNSFPWIGISRNISGMGEYSFWSCEPGVGRLYIIKQGSIWRPGKTGPDVMWRIQDSVHKLLYEVDYNGRWKSLRTGKLLRAERVTYDELLLEELFG